jgi:hypothetical protein
MEKADNLSFPTVLGLGGHGQSHHNEVLVGAKGLSLCSSSKSKTKSKRLPLQK